jgi:hypothetical protein
MEWLFGERSAIKMVTRQRRCRTFNRRCHAQPTELQIRKRAQEFWEDPRKEGGNNRPSWNKLASSRLARMPKYFFHLAGQLPARDLFGHECTNDKEAKAHASFIAHRIGTEKPEMVREGNYISMTNEQGDEIFQIALASTAV